MNVVLVIRWETITPPRAGMPKLSGDISPHTDEAANAPLEADQHKNRVNGFGRQIPRYKADIK